MALTEGQKAGGVIAGIAAFIAILVALARKAVAAPPVVVCTPGEEKCIGLDRCRCKDDGTGWIVITPNAPECQVTPGLAILYGTVKDIETGLPIANALIQLNSYSAYTSADGTYRIEDIEPGRYEGSVQAEGYERYYF